MSIPVACQCGQRFMAQPHLAGQVVRCPVCGQGITVPAPGLQQFAPPAHVPPVYGASPHAAPAWNAPGQAPQYQPRQRSGPGPLVYLGILGGVFVLLMFSALAAVLIGYDLARTALSKPKEVASAGPAKETTNAAPPMEDSSAAVPKEAAPPNLSQGNGAAAGPGLNTPDVSTHSGSTGKWQTHTSESGRYSVSLPGTIVPGGNSPFGGGTAPPPDMSLEQVFSQTDDHGVAMVLVIEVPAQVPAEMRKEMVEKMLQGITAQGQGFDGKQEKITIAGRPGIGLRFSRSEQNFKVGGWVRAFEHNGRIYQLMWASPGQKSSETIGEQFFNSFKLLPGAGSASLAQGNGPSSSPFSRTPRETPRDVDGLAGPVVVFQMLDYTGSAPSGAAAKNALSNSPWFNGSVVVNHSTGEIIAGRIGSSINTGPSKSALEAAGFKIGTTSLKSSGR